MEKDMTNTANGRKHEGPKKHLITFAISIVLTIIAFAAVGTGLIQNPLILIAFILVLAVIQAGYQLYVWMHLKDEGHRWPALMIYTGGLVAVITVISFILWVWIGI
jgi:cytochrome c oxidase subunit 4